MFVVDEIYKTDLFIKWFSKLPSPMQTQIQMRLDRILGTGHFGGTKSGQQKDIKKAKKILKTIKEDQSPFT